MRLDSVLVRNLTQGWQETLFWPDTVLVMQEGTGIDDYSGTNTVSQIQLSQNTPNPFTGITYVNMALAEEGKVLVEVTDMAGRVVVFNNYPSLQKGLHQMRISLSTSGVYFLTARMNENASTVKMINQNDGGLDKIEYQDVVEKPQALFSPKSGTKDSTANPLHLGDEMEYVGFATVNSIRRESAHITQAQNESQTIGLTFILPHDAEPTVITSTATNITTTSADTYSETDPYFYDYTGSSLTLAQRGYLYNWPAVMNGATSSSANPSGVQGICPTGWTFSSDICNVGNDLSSNNATGFSAVPAGYCYNGYYSSFTETNFWSATESSNLNAYKRFLRHYSANVISSYSSKRYGYSVRCLRD